MEIAKLTRQKELEGGQEMNRLLNTTGNWAWLSAVTYRLNGTELSQVELLNNLRLRYGLMPQDIPATCDGCGQRFLIDHAISCPKGSFVLACHDESAKEWVALGAQALVPSAISYKPKINIRIVKGNMTGSERGRTVEQPK